MPQGTVKWYDSEKGFGFIQQADGGSDMFVHHSGVEGNGLDEGDTVEFEIGQGKKGPCAVSVKRV